MAGTIVLAASVAATGQALERIDQGYLDAAVDAAKWIRASAVKTAAGVTWPADPAHESEVRLRLARPGRG